MENPFKTWGKDSKSIIMGTAMLGAVGANANTNELPKNLENKKIEIKSEIKKGHDENTFDLNKINKKESIVEDSLNLAEFCKTGSIEFVSPAARENAINAIANYLKDVDFENNSINVLGLCSKERPTPDNDELRENRRKLGVQMVNEALSKVFTQDQIEKILRKLESSSKEMSIFDLGITREEFQNMDSETLKNLIDQTQGIKISLKKILKIENLEKEKEIPEPYDNAILVILDNSKSMEGEAREALKIIKDINDKYGKEIKVVSLKGKNKEAHLETLIEYLPSIEIQKGNKKEVIVMTDEPDNDIRSEEEYNIKIKQVLVLAKEKNVEVIVKVFHPDQQIGGSKMVSLNDYPQALFIDQKARKNGSETVFWESKTKAWYDSLPNNQIDLQNLSSR